MSKRPSKSAISRVPKWARAAALALAMKDPSREKSAARTRSDAPTDVDLEDQLERDDAELLAHMRARGELSSSWEQQAGDRVIKKWLDDDEHFTMADRVRWADGVMRDQMVGTGFARAFNAAEQQAALMERSVFQIGLGRRASPEMTLLAEMTRQMREQGVYP